MNKSALYLSTILICSLSMSAQVALHGLFTPVQLQPDTTKVYLRDYLPDLELQSYELPDGLADHSVKDDTLFITGRMDYKMDWLDIATSNGPLALPFINTSVKEVKIAIPAKLVHGNEVRIIGAFNNWNRGSEKLNLADGKYTATYRLNPGRYEYKLFVDGKEMLDPNNDVSVSNGMGGFNNVIVVSQPDPSNPDITAVSIDEANTANLIIDGNSNTEFMVLWNNTILKKACASGSNTMCRVTIPEEAKKIKRSYIRVYSYSKNNRGRDQLVPLEYGEPLTNAGDLERLDWHQARMYFLMVDRFNNGEKENDLPTPDTAINPKANYMGGDLAGVTQKIDDGYFQSLHTNTIWLSPITQNPTDAWGYWDKGEVKSKFSAYHGYWPVSNIRVDFRFGTESELKELLDDAHNNNQNVILDYVANHVHINHPIYQKHPNWATSLYLPDGTKNTEKWDEHRLTTWFDDHLPTLDLRRWEVVDPLVDSATFWVTHYDFDGFRHDATKHIDELYWRTLTYRVRKLSDKPIIQIGETYGSPQLINSYISTGMLDAQFDFNLYDAAVSAFASAGGNVENLKIKLEQGLSVYGYHHLMGNITGNQDRSRFISLASGDVKFEEDQKLAGWDRQIGKPSAEAYKRLALIHAFNNAVPGIPCIYYGDEFGMPGGGDPDNRRIMKFEGLDDDESKLLQQVKKLNELRNTDLALIYGTTDTEVLEGSVLKVTRKYFDSEIVIYINTTNGTNRIAVPESSKILTGSEGAILFKGGPETLVELGPVSYIYIKL